MKVSEYVAQYLSTITDRVYGVCGAGAMHLNDAICNHSGIKFVAMHHEQAAAYAAEADARVSNQIGVVHVTAGPGVTNTVTGVACAWVDSIPMLVIAGQVDTKTMLNGYEPRPRQLGVSEVDGVAIMEPITKWATTVTDPMEVRRTLERAAWLAKEGRPGPVFVEIPLNVQAMDIKPEHMFSFDGEANIRPYVDLDGEIEDCVEVLTEAKRPVILLGNGVHLAGAEAEAGKLLDLDIPILTSWNASDLFDSSHPHYIGRPGLIGDRAANFTIQNADVILAVGTRLTIPMIGHSTELFAPKAKIIMVDIDETEMEKSTLHVDLPIVDDAGDFLVRFLEQTDNEPQWAEWLARCQQWKREYPVVLPEYYDNKDGVNSYVFIEELAKHIADDAIIVTDVGTAFVCTMQCMPMTGEQRLFHTSGIAPMGYGLPAAIGAYFASHGERQIICICGDGGIMFNLQELQTIAHHRLPIKIFVLCNDGYLTMQHTQLNHFKRESAASKRSGVSCANFMAVAHAFKIEPSICTMQRAVPVVLDDVLQEPGASLCQVNMPKGQILQPRVQSRMVDGRFMPVNIADLWPHLPRAEYENNMRQEWDMHLC